MTLLPSSEIPSDLSELYSFCNERYFDNELPKNIAIESSSKMSKCLGKAFKSNNSKSNIYKIKLSELILNDPYKRISIMTHEMIHIWQWESVSKTGNNKYLDDPRSNNSHKYFSDSSSYFSMHGYHFHSKMDELNKNFTELKISTRDDGIILDNEVEFYGVLVEYENLNKPYSVIYHNRKNVFESCKDEIVNDIKSLYGEENLVDIKYFSTTDARICSAPKMTNSGNLKKGSRQVYLDENFIKDIIESELTNVFGESKIEISDEYENIDQEIKKTINSITDYKGLDLHHFIRIAVDNSKVLNNLLKANNMDATGLLLGLSDKVNNEILYYIIDKWESVSITQFLNTASSKSAIEDISRHIYRASEQDEIAKIFDSSFIKNGVYRLNNMDFRTELYKKIISFSKRKLNIINEEVVASHLDKIIDKSIPKSIMDIKGILHTFIDSSLNDFVQETILHSKKVGLKSVNLAIPDIIKLHSNPDLKLIKDTYSQQKFSMAAKKFHLNKDALDLKTNVGEIVKNWEGRVNSISLVTMLLANYRKELVKSNRINFSETIERIEVLKKELLPLEKAPDCSMEA